MALKYNISYEVASTIFLVILLCFFELQYDTNSRLNNEFRKLVWFGFEGTGTHCCLYCCNLFCLLFRGDCDLQFAKISDMAENFSLFLCIFSGFRYSSSDGIFPGYTSGTFYECSGTYDDTLYIGDT